MNGPPLINKTTIILFTPYPAEYSTILSLKLNNQTIPYNKTSKIIGITLDPKLTFLQHINITITKAKQMLNIPKAFTSTKWVKQKELIICTCKLLLAPFYNMLTPYLHMELYHIINKH